MIDLREDKTKEYRYEVAMGNVYGSSTWNKFGYNADINGVAEIVASFGGTFNIMKTADTLNVVSTANSDNSGGQAARTIVLVGIDANGDYQEETVTMNGQIPVTTVNTWLGINRALVASVGTFNYNAGNITISDTSAIFGTQAQIPSMKGITQQSIFHVPSGYKFLSDWLEINASRQGATPFIQVFGYVYDRSSNVRQQIFTTSTGDGQSSELQLTPSQPFVINEDSVLYFEATSNQTNTLVALRFSGILKKI